MEILIQAGNLGYSILDHLISPLANSKKVSEVSIVCLNPGPPLPKVKYLCPPGIFRKISALSFIYEAFTLFFNSLFKRKCLRCRIFVISAWIVSF